MKLYVSCTKDNDSGCHCKVFTDEKMTHQIDEFCIRPEDCDCNNPGEVENFVSQYIKTKK